MQTNKKKRLVTLIRPMLMRAGVAAYELSMIALPIWLLLVRDGLPDVFHPSWAGVALIASITAAACSDALRSWWLCLLAALAVAAGALWTAGPSVASAAGAALVVAAIMQGWSAPLRRSRPLWPWTGVAMYFAASVAAQFHPAWTGITGTLAWIGTLQLAVALYAAHDRNIRDISLADHPAQRVPREMRRQIRIYAAVLLLAMLALAAGLGGMIIHALKYAAIRIFGWLLDLLRSEPKEPITEEPPAMPQPQMPEMEPTEPSLFSEILNYLFYAVGIAILLGFLYLMLSRLYRNRRDLWDKWMSWIRKILRLRARTVSVATGYTDEESSLFSWEETLQRMRNNRLGRLLAQRKEPGYDELPDNRAKVRYLYRKWLQALSVRGYEVKRHFTPSELSADVEVWNNREQEKAGKHRRSSAMSMHDRDALIRLYYEARYSDREPAGEQLEQIRRQQSDRGQ